MGDNVNNTYKASSMKDVAKAAGVSITTVSRIINNIDYPVSQKVRESVEKAIDELGYIPNRSAQNLRTNVENTVGLIVRDIGDPYFSEIAKGVTEKSAELKHLAMISDSKRDYAYELEYIDLLIYQRVKGIIIAGGGYENDEYKKQLEDRLLKAKQQGIKILALAPQGISIPLISVDNFSIGEKMCQLLVDQNHKNIAFIGGDNSVITNKERFEGYLSVLKKNNLKMNENIIIHGQFTWEAGYANCKELLARENKLDAILCVNDNIAVGALGYLSEMKIGVPSDISVVGVGDISIAQYTNPPLTTIRLPFRKLGKKAVEFICSEEESFTDPILLDSEVVIRDSMKFKL